MQLTRRAGGFTLIEMSVVLVVVALLLGSLLVPLSTQVEQRQVAETQKMLEEAREALIGYAIMNGRLPRPAQSPTNGTERGTCANPGECTGLLPWATLGLPAVDAFGKRLRYSVAPEYATASITFSTPSTNLKTVQTRDGATTPTLVSGVPAVILSHGANNFGVSESGTEFDNISATNADEVANDNKFKCATSGVPCDNFMSRTRSANTVATGWRVRRPSRLGAGNAADQPAGGGGPPAVTGARRRTKHTLPGMLLPSPNR